MFTGIVESVGKIASINRNSTSMELTVQCPFSQELELGESVAVNGTCLTVSRIDQGSFSADVTPESFRRTSLGELSPGSSVNLERAMKADGRFGGHIVSGHIDGTGIFIGAQKEENAVNIKIEISEKLGRYIIEKGSVAIDGISLTVTRIEGSYEGNQGKCFFSAAVIPHTWENTILSKKNLGSTVNIECDIVGKYIEHFLNWSSLEKEGAGPKNSDSDQSLEKLMTDFTSFH